MENYINSVLLALREDSDIIVGERIDKVDDFFFIDAALKAGESLEGVLLDFDENHVLTVVSRFGEAFSTDTAYVNALAYIALSRANDALFEKRKPGKCLLNLDIGKARFIYSASVPLFSEPKEIATFIKQVLEGIIEVRGMLTRFAQHPVLEILFDEDINVNDEECE